jgi:hypothetical protein
MIPCGRALRLIHPAPTSRNRYHPRDHAGLGHLAYVGVCVIQTGGGQQDGLGALGHGQIFVSGRNR